MATEEKGSQLPGIWMIFPARPGPPIPTARRWKPGTTNDQGSVRSEQQFWRSYTGVICFGLNPLASKVEWRRMRRCGENNQDHHWSTVGTVAMVFLRPRCSLSCLSKVFASQPAPHLRCLREKATLRLLGRKGHFEVLLQYTCSIRQLKFDWVRRRDSGG
jgi:hypothetical protein